MNRLGAILDAELLHSRSRLIRSRYGSALLVGALGLAATLAVSAGIFGYTGERITASLERSADNLSHDIERSLSERVQDVAAMAGTLAELLPLSREEFEDVTAHSVRHDKDLHAISWVPLIAESNRQGYAAIARAEGLDQFLARNPEMAAERPGPLTASSRYPVFYLSPERFAARLHGLDLAGFPRLAQRMRDTVETAQASAVVSDRIDTFTDNRMDVVIIAPVFYRSGTRAPKPADLAGFVVGFYDIADVIAATGNPADGSAEYLLTDNAAGGRPLAATQGFFDARPGRLWGALLRPEVIRPIEVAALDWSLRLRAPDQQTRNEHLRSLSAPLIGGLGISVLLFALFSAGARHGQRVRAIANTLRESNRRLRAESEAREQKEKDLQVMRLAIEHSPAAVMITQPDGTIEYVNETFEAITGHPRTEAIGCKPNINRSGYTAQSTYETLWNSIKAGQAWHGELLNRRRNNEEYWVKESVWPINDEQGQAKRFVAMFEDITERLRERDRLRLLSFAIDQSNTMVIIANACGEIEYVNQRFGEVTGLDPETLNGQRLRSLLDMEPTDTILWQLGQSLDEGRAWKGEVRHLTQAGDPYWASVSILPLYNEQSTVTHFMAVSEDVTDRVDAEAQIRHLALHDTLTGLANRHQFNDRLRQACALAARGQIHLALLLIDLDDFKGINDTLGHDAGDELLREVAHRLVRSTRQSDTVSKRAEGTESLLARIGGDEFYVLLPTSEDPLAVATTVDRILTALAKPFAVGFQEISVGVSVGIALCPGDATDPGTLIKYADIALYESKSKGRGSYRFFEASMEASIQHRKMLEKDLRRSLQTDGGLCMHYQPQVELASGRMVGGEALLRWQHPQLGAVSPAEFIPIAEASGLIIEVGRWVVREVCRQIAEWQGAGATPVPIAVNLSAVQFLRDDLLQLLEEACRSAGIAPTLLGVEVTESVVVDDRRGAARTLGRLREVGVQVALDDFGTGYSSLAYLIHFPLDKIKLDRSFIHGIAGKNESQAVVAAVLELSHKLGMRVVAEGAEADDDLRVLSRLGIDEVQGYFFSRPLPAQAFLDCLTDPLLFQPQLAGLGQPDPRAPD